MPRFLLQSVAARQVRSAAAAGKQSANRPQPGAAAAGLAKAALVRMSIGSGRPCLRRKGKRRKASPALLQIRGTFCQKEGGKFLVGSEDHCMVLTHNTCNAGDPSHDSDTSHAAAASRQAVRLHTAAARTESARRGIDFTLSRAWSTPHDLRVVTSLILLRPSQQGKQQVRRQGSQDQNLRGDRMLTDFVYDCST